MRCGEKIKYFREQLGMSQDELARRTGYAGKSAISRIESGARDISQSKIKVFAHVLGVEAVSLVSDRDPSAEQQMDADRQRLINYIERLQEDALPTYRALLEMPIERLRAIVNLLQQS